MKTFSDPGFGQGGYAASPGMPLQGYATVPATSDAKAYLRLLLDHKLGIVLAALLGSALAWLYLISTPPVYETAALVEVVDRGGFLDDEPTAVDWNAPGVREEINRLQSRRVLQPVVEEFGLRTRVGENRVPVLSDLAERIPALGEWISTLSMARPYAWRDSELELTSLEVPRRLEDRSLTLVVTDGDTFRIERDERVLFEGGRVGEPVQFRTANDETVALEVAALDAEPGVEFSIRRRSLEETIRGLRSRLSAETSDSKSRMITVKLSGDDPAAIADLTNAIVQQYQAVRLGSENLASQTELGFFEESLPRVERELREAEVALAEYRERARIYDQDTQTRSRLGQLDVLESELIGLQLDRDELTERYTEAHPSTRRLDKEISVLTRKIAEIQSSIRGVPASARELSVLQQEVETKLSVFNDMSEQLQRLRIAQAGNIGSVDIYDPALAPRKPVSPNKRLALLAGTLGTLFLYLVYLTLRSALSTTISDQESLQRASGLPVYMNIPKSAAQRRIGSGTVIDPKRLLPGSTAAANAVDSNVLAIAKPEDYSVENLRGLRSMMEDVMADADNNVLMITSPLPSMGKSFLSLNLAVLIAQSGRRVLLIDADYQRGQLHKSLGLPMGPGLPEVVRGKSELRETVKVTSVQNLYCIPRGFSGNAGAIEMPADKEFAAFMQVVAPRFDIVIMDTPPVLSVATAASVGRHAGSTVMVVREGQVKEPQLNEAIKRLMFSGVQVSGCILNGSSGATPRHYAYYHEKAG